MPSSRKRVSPAISVIMPNFNGSRFLAESIESILNQTFGDFEFLILDDASTDNSVEIINEYVKKDKRIRLLKQNHNRGVAVCLNRLLQAAQAPLIARMDSDDVSLPTRLAKQVQYLETKPKTVLLGTQMKLFDHTGKNWKKPLPCSVHTIRLYGLTHNPFAHPSVMFRKDVVEQVGGYPDAMSEDYALWSKIMYDHPVANLNECLLNNRVHYASVSKTSRRSRKNEVKSIALSNITAVAGFDNQEADSVYHFFSDHQPDLASILVSWQNYRRLLKMYIHIYKPELGLNERLEMFKLTGKYLKIKFEILPWADKINLLRQLVFV